jgi:hypothetical protein
MFKKTDIDLKTLQAGSMWTKREFPSERVDKLIHPLTTFRRCKHDGISTCLRRNNNNLLKQKLCIEELGQRHSAVMCTGLYLKLNEYLSGQRGPL